MSVTPDILVFNKFVYICVVMFSISPVLEAISAVNAQHYIPVSSGTFKDVPVDPDPSYLMASQTYLLYIS